MKESTIFDGHSIQELIRKRSSIRKYKNQNISAEEREMLTKYFGDVRGPFNAKVRFLFVENNMKNSELKLGTYGFIKEPPAFIIAAVEKKEMYMEQLGYEFEKVVLYATSLGLGTCWLGGTFRKGEFAKAVKVKENEEMPIVSPVGYPSDSRGLLERMMRAATGADNRKNWDELFFYRDFSAALGRDKAGRYADSLEMVRLAPSASNKQPWRVVVDNGYFHFYLQHTKGYTKMQGYDIQKIDMGIAMCHFDLSMQESGITGRWAVEKPEIKNVPDDTEYIISWKVSEA